MKLKSKNVPRAAAARALVCNPRRAARNALAVALFGILSALPVQALAGERASLKDFLLSKSIVDREPTEVTEGFAASDQNAYAFARVDNPGAPTSLAFVWHLDNHHHATIHATVGTSSAWRTWSSVQLKPGLWSVQVVSEDGQILGQRSFRILNKNTAIVEVPADSGAPVVPASD